MRILYVVSRPLEINTSASIRNKATIGGLLELGHNIDLITTEYDKNHSNFDGSLSNDRLNVTYLKLSGIQGIVKISRKFKVLKPLKNIAYKIMSNFEIYDNLKGMSSYAMKVGISDIDYDVIISSSDPKSSHLFVSELFEKNILKNTPWIQIWGDPFLSDITRKNKLMKLKINKEEDRLLKYAKKAIYVSSLTLKLQKEIYPHYAKKMYCEPIPYVKKEIYPIKNIKEETLTFLYCGDYSSRIRDIKPFYEAIKNTKHKLIICGGSDIKLECTDRIKIYPRVSFEKTKELERECDVLVHLSNLKGTQIPGKIYQYSGTNKLILFLLDGDSELLKETFMKYKRYIFAQNNIEVLEKSIEQINKNKYNNYRFVVEEFSPKTIADRIIKI
ncbi:hypothetical protein [Psychrobacillus sp. BM2]|uniref:hypothetical protein n=1 Tax=Psychrobacillus sp. BM2 TaxID=3400421 RepID=UPI003B02B058